MKAGSHQSLVFGMQRDARIPRSRWTAEVAQSKQLCLHGGAAEPVTPRHIKHNATLQPFSMDAWETQIGDATGVAMAEAIKQNATLQSFSIGAAAAQIGDATLCKDCRSRPCYSDKSELGRVLCFSGQRTGLVALGFCCLSRPLSSRRLR